MSEQRGFSAIALLIILSLIWGTSFILIKKGLVVFAPDEVASIRISAAALFLLPMAIMRVNRLNRGHYWKLFLSGMMGVFIPAFLFPIAQTRLDSSLAGILNTLSTLWTMIIGAVFFQLRFKAIAVIGIAVGFGGTVILMLSRSGGTITGINYFALFIVLACALYGANLNWVKFKISDLSSLTITSISLALILPFSLIYLFGFTEFTVKLTSHPDAMKAFGYVVLLAFMSTSIATVLFNKLVKMTTPLYASTVTYIMPIIAVMWGVIDGEHLFFGHIIGMACIIGGVYLANKRSS